uniref:Anaphase-promoting complex subunit 4 WD40 domain-containing protein n=1 Tax=Hemiselmis tepida TaxID=464990 RepID=A0A7S0YQK3_9CRYP
MAGEEPMVTEAGGNDEIMVDPTTESQLAFAKNLGPSADHTLNPTAPNVSATSDVRREREPAPNVSFKQFSPELTLGEMITDPDVTGHEVFCTRYSPDGNWVAAACGDGDIKVYSSATGAMQYQLKPQGDRETAPTCCVRFRPNTASSRTKNVLLSVCANGTVRHWHMTSMKCLHTIVEGDNQVYALDYRPDGLKFATAGQDYQVRIYDEATKTLQSTLSGGYGRTKAGHSNRVFSLKYSVDDPNLILSGGWDNTIQIWDVRQDVPVRSCFGPHITGDAVDLKGHEILSGSWRPEKQLQVWDLRTTQHVRDYVWTSPAQQDHCMLYAAQYSKDLSGKHIVAGGSGSNEARVFERESGNLLGTLRGMHHGVYSTDFHPTAPQVAVASGDGAVRLVNYLQ